MKKLARTLIALSASALLVFGTATTALAATTTDAPPGITVRGEGIVTATPDTAAFSASIITTGKTAEECSRTANKKLAALLDALTTAGIQKDDITSDYTRTSPIYDYTDDVQKISGYRTTLSVTVQTSNIDAVGSYIDVAIKAGSTNVGSAYFFLEDSGEAYEQALKLAVQNANRSATALATACGKSLGSVYSIVENSSNAYAVEDSSATMDMDIAGDSRSLGKGATVITYGEINVRANIVVTYNF